MCWQGKILIEINVAINILFIKKMCVYFSKKKFYYFLTLLELLNKHSPRRKLTISPMFSPQTNSGKCKKIFKEHFFLTISVITFPGLQHPVFS